MAVGRRIAAGDVVAGYEVGELVGRGGMGEVFRAIDVRLDRPVALKLLVERLSGDEGFRERLLRESRLAASLDHPNVVPIYEAGEADGRLFIAMRYVDGTDLKSLLRREGRSSRSGRWRSHPRWRRHSTPRTRKGLVHRDVKPSNVLLDQAGGREHVYLADFGLTQSVSDTGPTDGQLMGTVDYVAPEQIRGDRVDGRADVYALGCLLFECLTGTLPFSGGSDVAVVYAHLEEDPPRASERRPGLPQAVDAVFARGMAKDPRGPAGELRGARRRRRGRRSGSYSGSRPRGDGSRSSPSSLPSSPPPPRRRRCSRHARGDSGRPPVDGGSLVRIDPATNEVTASYAVSAYPGIVVTAQDRVWLGDFRDGSLWRLDPERGDVQRFTTTGEPRDLTSLGGQIYVAGDGETMVKGTVTRYDAVTGTRQSAVPVLACSVAAGEGVLWAAGCPLIVRLSTDAGDMRVLLRAPVPFQQPHSAETTRIAMHDMAVGEGALWVLGDPIDRRVFRVDRRTGDPRHDRAPVRAPVDRRRRGRRLGDGFGRRRRHASTPRAVVASRPSTWAAARAALQSARARSGWRAPWRGRYRASTRCPARPWLASRSTVPPREVAVGAGGVWVTADAG